MTKFRRRTEFGLPVPQHVPSENPKITTLSDIQSLARDKTEAALLVLAAIMNRETANAFARVAAAKELLDRGWGRPVQQLATDAGPVEFVQKIERVIVHPNQPQAIANQVNNVGDLRMSQTISPREEILR
ncbi:hypothetical protein [Bradyrhizobium sp. 192]|uniref:hypothetical protein n=1 Tax=Bradyrhizobium sp. 192 TaxID=2782660 RepID=UPI001FFE88A0|nr:hypothetical protein [Bradyrhizobium sp. 192]UPJ56684.1 hypothetical protein IVB24_29345 [Bradyrhizobium sp. 192]